jgi:hypothetical protein
MEHPPEILREREEPGCWRFELRDGGRLHHLRLAWADYDLLSPSGDRSPAAVAEAVFLFLRSRPELSPLPDRLDAAWARRIVPGADAMIAAALSGRRDDENLTMWMA